MEQGLIYENFREPQMMNNFNVQQVLEMAIRIEENGAAFYRKAASIKESFTDKEFFEALARVEDRHKFSFESMQKKQSTLGKTQIDCGSAEVLSLYLKAMADTHGGEGNRDSVNLLTGQESIEEIISMAIELEKESILFYIELKDILVTPYGQEMITKIINEEKQHIAQLNKFLTIAQKTAPENNV